MNGGGLSAFLQQQRLNLQRLRLTGELVGLARRFKSPPRAPFDARTPHYDATRGLFTFSGSQAEIGRQFAEALPMEPTLRVYDALRRQEAPALLEQADRMLAAVAGGYREFLHGIAAHYTGYSYETVLRMACCTVLDGQPVTRSCTSLAIRHAAPPLIGQNLDLGMDTLVALACIRPERGRARLAVVNVGYPWMTAIVNDAGLTAAGSSVNVAQAHVPSGDLLPQEIVFDLLLSGAGTVAEAVDAISALPALGPLNGGITAVLADCGGDIREIEWTGGSRAISAPCDAAITANHFRQPEMMAFNRRSDWLSMRLEANSAARYGHAAALAARPAAFTRERLRSLLRDAAPEGAWLRKARWPDIGYTTVSYLVDLAAGEVEVWLGAGATTSSRLALADCFGAGAC
jgi:hypothetical protein